MRKSKISTKGLKGWRLGSCQFIVKMESGGFGWFRWYHIESECLDQFSGIAVIQDNVLILSPWKVRDTSQFNNYREIKHFLSPFPKWKKTKYVMFNIGATSSFDFCDTLKPVPNDVCNILQTKLGLCDGNDSSK